MLSITMSVIKHFCNITELTEVEFVTYLCKTCSVVERFHGNVSFFRILSFRET